MPIKEAPTFKQVSDKFLEIAQPAISGLNLKDLEYEQETDQTPYCLNMMYRNGSFSKRYGQEIYNDITYGDAIHSMIYYKDHLVVHAGTKIYKDGTDIGASVIDIKGLFIKFNRFLYYIQPPQITSASISSESTAISNLKVDLSLFKTHYTVDKTFKYSNSNWKIGTTKVSLKTIGITYDGTPKDDDEIKVTLTKVDGNFWQYNDVEWKEVEPYVPDLVINRKPDGSYSDVIESYNMIGAGFKNTFHGDGSSKEYVLTSKGDDLQDKIPKVWFDTEDDDNLQDESTYTYDKENGKITFTTAPEKGTNNVIVEAFYSQNKTNEYRDKILKSKYSISFGGNNNSSLFLAGGGESIYYYSEVFDGTYFPEEYYASVGDSAEDITGFGLQYNVLIIFKPKEMYSLTYYLQTTETTSDDNEAGTGAYEMVSVNNAIGCDAPYSIQLVNNKLTWFNSIYGVCTLVSTNIQNERNVIPISRNIDRTNNFDVIGILDLKEDLDSIRSVDFDSKYMLVFPNHGYCFMWDYKTVPYYYTSSKETNVKNLDWFLFDKFYVKDFLQIKDELVYSTNNSKFNKNLIKLNDTFHDIDFDGDGENDPIVSYYMTPYLQFNAVEYLKNVTNIYVQCRGDTSSVIDMWYYTEESINGEQETDSIRIGGKVWSKFKWEDFQWLTVNHAKAFRRKCSLKKIEMCAFLFKNDEVDRDMSISHISLQYNIAKLIK